MKLCRVKALLLLAIPLAVPVSQAQLLSVDVNGTVRSDVTAPGFTPWFVSPDLSGTKRSVSRSFTNYSVTLDPDSGLPIATNISSIIGCTIAQTVPNPGVPNSTICLNANYANKNGNTTSTDPNAGWRLCEDAVWVHEKNDATSTDRPYLNGGALRLTLSNLSAGIHTITTYHNDLWGTVSGGTWHGANSMSRCLINVNGSLLYTNVPTYYATNDSQCGFAFFSVTNTNDGDPVVIDFAPDHSSPLDFVVLNGFEIDRPFAPGTSASAIFPAPGDEHVFANNDAAFPGSASTGGLTINWLPAAFAVSNFVYFGTSSNAVAQATMASPEFKDTSAAITGATNSLSVTNLDSRLTYFWRVDQLDLANGATNLVRGFVWNFRTRHLAFPTAEGYGRFARGGRGGVVIEVTNLNDSGPGSYRAAIAANGPRTIVFRVSGLIRLQSPCVIGNGYVTVAGQTAPGEGICLANWRAGMGGCSDVIMRFMRCRLGDASKQAMDGIGLGNANNSIIDHCSISWTTDEGSSSRQSGAVGSQSSMITFQHNIISEPLQHSYHYNDAERAATGCTNCYQAHAFAASISGEIGSYHHNLIAHSTDRNWSLAGGLDQSQHYAGSLDIRNNVVYNWTARTTDGGVARCNYVNNFYKSYSSNPSAKYLLKLDTLVPSWGTEAYYMVGNVMTGVSGQANLYPDNWANGGFQNGPTVQAQVQTNAEIFPSYVNTQSASNAYKLVLSDVGCNLPVPDVIDHRIIGEVLDRTTHYIGTNGSPYIIDGVVQDSPSANLAGIIDKQTDVRDATNSPNFPWPAYATFKVPVDSDHDGLPDWWELIHGTNPQSSPGDFSDSNADPNNDGYTDLEDYLNWLAGIHVECDRDSHVDVELTQFTRGFTNNSPVYGVLNATNGTINVLLDGKTARFNPAPGFHGLGSFQFKVTDAQGFSLTNTVGVHVVANPGSQLAFSISNSTAQLSFAGESELFYLLQYSDDLSHWTTFTNTIATPSAQSFTPPGFPTASARFYRAISPQ